MTNTKKVFLQIILLIGLSVNAQKENNMWTFGYKNGINFNTNPPTHFESEVALSWEGCSSVSDENGNLLFYTDSNVILNTNGTPMPNGSGIIGNSSSMFDFEGIFGSSAQGVAIAQKPDNPNQYYVFIASSQESRDWEDFPNVSPGYLRYSIVDMQLNGGLGDVVTGQKNIIIDEDINEKVTIVQGTGNFYWMISHSTGADFKVYRIDDSGISTGTHYPGLLTNAYGGGNIRISPDKQKIVHISYMNTIYRIEIGNFDASTGVISNLQVLETPYTNSSHSAVFSPNSQILYTAAFTPSNIYQYNLSLLPNVAAVSTSEIMLTNQGSGEMRNGPDGKIYFKQIEYSQQNGQEFQGIGIIHNPDILGIGSNLENTAFSLADLTPVPVNDSISAVAYYGIGQDAVILKSSLNTEELDFRNNVSVYPNPVLDNLQIELNQSGEYKIIVSDLKGRILKSISFHGKQYSFDMKTLPISTYLVTIQNKNRTTIVRKIIKK